MCCTWKVAHHECWIKAASMRCADIRGNSRRPALNAILNSDWSAGRIICKIEIDR